MEAVPEDVLQPPFVDDPSPFLTQRTAQHMVMGLHGQSSVAQSWALNGDDAPGSRGAGVRRGIAVRGNCWRAGVLSGN
jgi:hypothetical protein